jgi:hypothetical protein
MLDINNFLLLFESQMPFMACRFPILVKKLQPTLLLVQSSRLSFKIFAL